MQIRTTRPDDLDKVMKIYENARTFMAEHGNPTQWGDFMYPERSLIESDIAAGRSFVCTGADSCTKSADSTDSVDREDILAVFCFIIGPDRTYQVITGGQWLNDNLYGTIHRIASSGEKRGAATFCIKWAMSQIPDIRIDTHEKNTPMRSLLDKMGFVQVGSIIAEDGTPRIAYHYMPVK